MICLSTHHHQQFKSMVYVLCLVHTTLSTSDLPKNSGSSGTIALYTSQIRLGLTSEQVHKTLQFTLSWLNAFNMYHLATFSIHAYARAIFSYLAARRSLTMIFKIFAAYRRKYTVISITGDG